jgi:hypothetical protein
LKCIWTGFQDSQDFRSLKQRSSPHPDFAVLQWKRFFNRIYRIRRILTQLNNAADCHSLR